MKTFCKFCYLGLLTLLWPGWAHGALNQQRYVIGKFFVSSINGTVTCTSEGRVFDLKKGDTVEARGATITTAEKANVIVVFSNGTGVYVDADTRLDVHKFDQEFFAPNNNLRVEPSNSATVVKLKSGRLVISTPRLLSGTTMFYETPHAAVGIRGDKVLIEASEKQTHVAMIAGHATVNPRDAEGKFVSIGKRLVTGQEAFVKYTVSGTEEREAADKNLAGTAATQMTVAGIPAEDGPADKPIESAPVASTADTEAELLQLSGPVQIKATSSSKPDDAALGGKLPRGATVITGENGEAVVGVFPGAIATVRPETTMAILSNTATAEKGLATKQTAQLELTQGTVISTIDPAKSPAKEYSIRTPQGTVTATGTSFFTSVDASGLAVGVTADRVVLVSSTGSRYEIAAGNVSISSQGGPAQAPVALAAAASSDPRIGLAIRAAFDAVANVVERNLGGLSPQSAATLLARVSATVTAADPSAASAITVRAIGVAVAPKSATAPQASAAAAAVIQAIVAASPGQAASIAVAAIGTAQAHDAAVGAAAAKAAPLQAAAITSAVVQALLRSDPSIVGSARVQQVGAIAAAVTASSVNQAGPVAGAALQTLLKVFSSSSPADHAQNAAIIDSAVTTAGPLQAVPVAATSMRLLVQNMPEATPSVVAQSAMMLGGAIIAVVPHQAQVVSTALMQMIVQNMPAAAVSWVPETSGLLAVGLTQLHPSESTAIVAGVALGAGISVADLEAAMRQHGDATREWSRQFAAIPDLAAGASAHGANAAQSVASGNELVGAIVLPFGLFGTGDNGHGGTSITIGANADQNSATSIVITQFDPGLVAQLTADIEAAQAAQTSVQFSTETTSNGRTTVRPEPVVPRTLPTEYVVSPARQG